MIDKRRTQLEGGVVIAGAGPACARFDLGPSRAALDALSAALDAFHAGIEGGAIAAGAANAALRDLARTLVPINFTRGPRFEHDPALNIPQLPTIEPALRLDRHDATTMGFAKAQLMRGQNRLVAALREAARRIERVGVR